MFWGPYDKFLAKLASDYRKPDGLFVIKPHQGLAFVEALKVEQFHGIGRVTAAKLNQMGIFTGLDLVNRPKRYSPSISARSAITTTASPERLIPGR